jgi:hypothetical protein
MEEDEEEGEEAFQSNFVLFPNKRRHYSATKKPTQKPWEASRTWQRD